MANRLINISNVGAVEAPAHSETPDGETQMAKRQLKHDPRPTPRCMLYSVDGDAHIFEGEENIAAAQEAEWQDTPTEAYKLKQAEAANPVEPSATDQQDNNALMMKLFDSLDAANKTNAAMGEQLAALTEKVTQLESAQPADTVEPAGDVKPDAKSAKPKGDKDGTNSK